MPNSNNDRGGNSKSGLNRNQSNRKASHPSTERSSTSGGFLNAVRQRPLASAAIAAGAAGAGAFLWAKRSQLSNQFSDITDSLSERFSGSEDSGYDSGTGMDPASEYVSQPMGSGGLSTKTQSDIAEEALSMKDIGIQSERPMDPTLAQQSKAGVIAY